MVVYQCGTFKCVSLPACHCPTVSTPVHSNS